jgi:hypothetical protein
VTGAIPQGRAVCVRSGEEISHSHSEYFRDAFQVVKIERDLAVQSTGEVRLSPADLFGQLDPADPAPGHPNAYLFGDLGPESLGG